MNVAASFVLGLLIGWLVEWIIDWFYWRRDIRASIGTENAPQLVEQQAALLKANQELMESNAELKARAASLQDKLDAQAAAAALANLLDKHGNDNFEAAKGIGPAFSKRLHAAGIHTFEQLSRLTPQEMEKILGTLFKRFFSKENTIIEQARKFAELKAKWGKSK